VVRSDGCRSCGGVLPPPGPVGRPRELCDSCRRPEPLQSRRVRGPIARAVEGWLGPWLPPGLDIARGEPADYRAWVLWSAACSVDGLPEDDPRSARPLSQLTGVVLELYRDLAASPPGGLNVGSGGGDDLRRLRRRRGKRAASGVHFHRK